MPVLSIDEADALVRRALTAAGASPSAAAATAAALVAAEADGQSGHGLGRVPAYAAQVKAGKIAGRAAPTVERTRPAALRIDAHCGFAYPALDLAITELPALAATHGVAAASVHASHHVGQAGRTVERLADRGLIALLASNTPHAMALHGGARSMLGTNPLAFAAPVPERAALVIDLSLSLVARSKIVAARRRNEKIPLGWATDARGEPTDDPQRALEGALVPIGGAKGAALALMVETLCAALAGAHFGWEASSFLDAEGPPPAVGQVLIALDPAAFSGANYAQRMATMLAAVTAEPGVRLPGDRRLAARERARREGLAVAEDLHAQIVALGAAGTGA